MLAYELYLHNGIKEEELIGILPERRKDPNRITKESVLNWGIMLLNDGANKKDIIIKQLRVNETTNQIFEVDPHFDK
jgi:hypothetical protein